MPCCIATKHAPIAAVLTVRVGARRSQRQHAITAAVTHHCNNKNPYIPIFFGPRSGSITSIAAFGGREGNRQSVVLGIILLILLLDWISESRRSFSSHNLLIYFLHSAAPQAHTRTRLIGRLPALLDLGKWHSLDQHLISTPLFSNVRYLGPTPVWRLTSILLYLVACLLFLGRGESALFTTS